MSVNRTPLGIEDAAVLAAKNAMSRKIHEAARAEGLTDEEMALRASTYRRSPRGGFTLPITDGTKPIFDPEMPLKVVLKDANRQVIGTVISGQGNFMPEDQSPVVGNDTPTLKYMWQGEEHARKVLREKAGNSAQYEEDPLMSLRSVEQPQQKSPPPAAPERRVLVTMGIPGTTTQVRLTAQKAFLSDDKKMLVLAFNEQPDLTGIPFQTALAAHLAPFSNAKPVTLNIMNFNIVFRDPDSSVYYVNLPLVAHVETQEKDDAEDWAFGWGDDQNSQPPVR